MGGISICGSIYKGGVCDGMRPNVRYTVYCSVVGAFRVGGLPEVP